MQSRLEKQAFQEEIEERKIYFDGEFWVAIPPRKAGISSIIKEKEKEKEKWIDMILDIVAIPPRKAGISSLTCERVDDAGAIRSGCNPA